MSQEQIFISYRREDTAGYARAIYDDLAGHFGAERVFIDVDDINPGQPFNDVIQQAVGGSKVLLVLIGKRWFGEREGKPPRIMDDNDFVRMEVATGLTQGMRVIPLLLDGATMPGEAQLPESLRPLAGRNALEIGNTRFAADIDLLVAELRKALGGKPSSTGQAKLAWIAIGIAVVLITLTVLWLQVKPRGNVDNTGQIASSTSTARPDINGEWQADVTYDWPNAHYTEHFVFMDEGKELRGSASFLGVARGILEGSTEPGKLQFITRTSETAGASSVEAVHRYTAKLSDGEIHFTMQTEGSSPHIPVEFVARRAAPTTSQQGR